MPNADQHRRPEDEGHQPRVEDVVVEAPRGLLAASESPLLQPPRGPQRAADRARPERVEALPEPGARGVLGGGDPDVVAAVVLDVEVAVADLGQRDLGQPALVGLLLVAELVGGVDADAADAADRDRQADPVDRRQRLVGEHAEDVPAADHRHRAQEAGVLDRQEEVGDPPVVAVLLERLDHVVRRVGAVEAGDEVDRRHDAEDDDRADPEPHAPAGRDVAAEGDERQARHDQADEPEVALAVGPELGGAVGDRAAGSESGGVAGHRRDLLPSGLHDHRMCKPG